MSFFAQFCKLFKKKQVKYTKPQIYGRELVRIKPKEPSMYKYGARSRKRLKTVHEDLQLIFNEAIKYEDIAILCGVRSKEEQDKAFADGKSQKEWPDSKHNVEKEGDKSMAIDAAPYPVDWDELNRFYMFVGRIKQIADELYAAGKIKHKIRCGADWDMDGWTNDQKFHDLPHVELAKP
jgi:peptidoglycan L-alanyl-D-glutamate endopeptidase CwlK